MLAWIIVFCFVILFSLGLIKIIDIFFLYKQQIKNRHLSQATTVVVPILALIISSILILSGIQTIVNLFSLSANSQNQERLELIAIPSQDCPKLFNLINKTEKAIEREENHRYIEEEVPLFSIKLEYQKGLEKIREQAVQYKNEKWQKNSEIYAQEIARQLEAKAKLFEQRINAKADRSGREKIYQLLEEMDEVTTERQNLIRTVRQQCT
jgi:hypothetical protein